MWVFRGKQVAAPVPAHAYTVQELLAFIPANLPHKMGHVVSCDVMLLCEGITCNYNADNTRHSAVSRKCLDFFPTVLHKCEFIIIDFL